MNKYTALNKAYKANKVDRERRGETRAIRLGQTFSLGEAIHGTRLMEAVEAGNLELAQRLLRDALGCNLRRKFVSMRTRGRKMLAEGVAPRPAVDIDAPIPFVPTGKEVL